MKTSSSIVFALSAFVAAHAGFSQPQASVRGGGPLQEVSRETAKRALSSAVAKGHPRLFASRLDFDRIVSEKEGDTLKAHAAARVRERAEFLLAKKPLEREMVGRRMLMVSRAALYRISTLAMAYRISGDRRFLDKATAEMKSVCAFPDWNPSHFLDVAEMSLAVSIGYDWLYNDLDAEVRAGIFDGLRRNALLPGLKGGWWARAISNWGQVCQAGMIAASIVLADDPALRDDCARIVSRSVNSLRKTMKIMSPDGCYPEGPGYWNYGVSYNVFAIAMLESACGTDYGLSESPGFWKTAEFPNAVTGPSGFTMGYSDSSLNRMACGVLWWFAGKLNRPDLLTEKELSVWKTPHKRYYRGWLPPLELIWMDGRKSGTVPSRHPRVWVPRGEMPIAVLRGGSGKDAAFVGLKGGSPCSSHGHMDGGNFVLEMGGVRWAWELPCEGYTRIEDSKKITLWSLKQDSSRWSLLRLNASGHNVPQINGEQQLVSGSATISKVSDDPDAHVQMDMSSLYGSADRVVRSCILSKDGRTFEIRDVFGGVRPGSEITWKFFLKGEASANGGDLELEYEGRRLGVVRTGTSASDWKVLPAKGGHPLDSPNPEYSVAMFTMTADAKGEASVAVKFSLKTGPVPIVAMRGHVVKSRHER